MLAFVDPSGRENAQSFSAIIIAGKPAQLTDTANRGGEGGFVIPALFQILAAIVSVENVYGTLN
jgi:hypothetical protein